MLGYLDKAIRQLVLILPATIECLETLKDGDKNKNNKWMSFRMDDKKRLEKYKATWTKIKVLKNVELNALLVYDDRYI